MRTCSRCKEIKPDQSFRKHAQKDDLDSHCWHCRCQVRNESRRRYPDRVEADKMLYERQRGNPEAFAYLTAKHVEAYVTGRIQRWQQKHGMEAHPHLTAIRQLAADLAAQTVVPHSLPANPRLLCSLCGEDFEPTSKQQRYCCKAHADRAKNRRKYERRKERKRLHSVR